MKIQLIFFVLLSSFVGQSQVFSEFYAAKIVYRDSVFQINYGCSESNGISYSYENISPDSILLKVDCRNYSSKYYNVVPYQDTFFQVEFGVPEENMFGRTRKPIIYLYPENETIIDVKLNFKGKLTNTYPDYDNGWQVIAKPNGDLINTKDNSLHRYLFWDGLNDETLELPNFETGFVVKNDEVLAFLDSSLSKIGLNDYEKNDFITFWMPIMKQNEFNLVQFMLDDECNEVATLNVNPKPDSELRFYILFKEIDEPIKIEPQILKTADRNGFVLVEWGGIVLNDIGKIE